MRTFWKLNYLFEKSPDDCSGFFFLFFLYLQEECSQIIQKIDNSHAAQRKQEATHGVLQLCIELIL